MLGDGAEFCSKQELALRAIIKNKTLILVIIGTRAKKSLLFILLACSISTSITIVVVLLVSLQSNLD